MTVTSTGARRSRGKYAGTRAQSSCGSGRRPPRTRRPTRPGQRSLSGRTQSLTAALNLRLGGRAVRPLDGLHHLAGLEGLVNREEVLDLRPLELGYVVNILQVFHPGICCGNAKDLVIRSLFVPHLEHPNGPRRDQAAREGRFVKQNQGVERITVLGQGVLDEPIVGWVPGRRKQHAVKPDPARVVVHLVLVPLPLGNLHDYLDVHVRSSSPILPYGFCLRTPQQRTTVYNEVLVWVPLYRDSSS